MRELSARKCPLARAKRFEKRSRGVVVLLYRGSYGHHSEYCGNSAADTFPLPLLLRLLFLLSLLFSHAIDTRCFVVALGDADIAPLIAWSAYVTPRRRLQV